MARSSSRWLGVGICVHLWIMIDLHYWPTPNGWKISIMLEECGLPYKLVPVNIGTGEQFKEIRFASRPQRSAIMNSFQLPATSPGSGTNTVRVGAGWGVGCIAPLY